MSASDTHIWYWRQHRPDRKDHPCRIICTWGPGGGPRNLMIEFPDGERIVAPRHAIRKTP